MAKRRRHRRHSRALSNPFSARSILSAPKEMISTQFITEAAGVAAGFVLPGMVMNYLPATWRASKIGYYASKVGTIAFLSAAGRMVSPRVSKFVLVGGGVSLMLDLYTEVMGLTGMAAPATAPAPAATAPLTAYYGDSLQAYYGGMSDFDIP